MHLPMSLCLLSLLPAADAPVIGRPREHFYGAVGERVRIAMRATPTELRVEDAIVLTVTVTGAENPDGIDRPDLRALDEYASQFFIDDLPDEASGATGDRVFRYRLRPKSERARALPPIQFFYYQPKLKYFAATATPDPIALKVTPRVTEHSTYSTPERPPLLYFIPEEADLHRSVPKSPDSWLLVVACLGPPFLFLCWYIWWRLQNPGAVRMARLRRLRVIRNALSDLRRLHDADPVRKGERAAAIVCTVLCERHGIPHSATTPHEIAHALTQARASVEVVEQAEVFFRACDAARFGPPGTAVIDMPTAAEKLILHAEDFT